MTSMRQNPLTCSGHTRPVVHLSFSHITPDGYFVISASKDAKPMLRQGETGDWIGTFEGHKGAVWAATLNYEASKAATGSADFTAKVWNAVTGDEVHSFAHKHIVKCVDFSPDSNYLLTGSNEKLLRIYDLNKPTEKKVLEKSIGYQVKIDDIQFGFTPGKGMTDVTFIVKQLTVGEEQGNGKMLCYAFFVQKGPEIIIGHTSNLKCCLWLDDKKIISAAEDKTIKLWDGHNKEEIRSLELKSAANDLEISVDGQILTVAYSNKVAFLNAQTFEVLKEFEVGSPINSASLHPTRNVFVCGGDDFKMYKCDYESGNELESFKGHFGSVHCVRFSPDGELYASGSEDGTLRLWQTIVGKTYGLWKCMQSDEVSLNNSTGDNAIKVDC